MEEENLEQTVVKSERSCYAVAADAEAVDSSSNKCDNGEAQPRGLKVNATKQAGSGSQRRSRKRVAR